MFRIKECKRGISLIAATAMIFSLISTAIIINPPITALGASSGGDEPVPGMSVIDQNPNIPLRINRTNGTIKLKQMATEGGIPSSGITNTSFLLFEAPASGSYSVTAKLTNVTFTNGNNNNAIMVGGFAGTASDAAYVVNSDAAYVANAWRGKNNFVGYYQKFKDNTYGSSKYTDDIKDSRLKPSDVMVATASRDASASTNNFTITYELNGGAAQSKSLTSGGDKGVKLTNTDTVGVGLALTGVASATVTDIKIIIDGKEVFNSDDLTGSYIPPRADWSTVADPVLDGAKLSAPGSSQVDVDWTAEVGNDGADSLNVTMKNSAGEAVGNYVTSDTLSDGTATFTPPASGDYTFTAVAKRDGGTDKISNTVGISSFVLPLAQPVVTARTGSSNSMVVKWDAVKEATGYKVEYKTQAATDWIVAAANTATTQYIIPSLTVGTVYSIRVTALRGDDVSPISEVINKELKAAEEREWKFIANGNSTSAANKFEKLSDTSIKLYSAIFDAAGKVTTKGGKILSNDFHDGMSYYYTVVDPKTENFVLTAKFKVDQIPTAPDGQEGFGIFALDRLPETPTTDIYLNNTVSLTASKFNGKKDVIGCLQKVGVIYFEDEFITPDPKTDIKAKGLTTNLVKAGDEYTMTMKKTNTGFHAILNNDTTNEVILYNPDALTVLDKDHIYVGFGAGRNCNVTVSDISMTTSNPATDPARVMPPIEYITPAFNITSLGNTSDPNYNMVLSSNADGSVKLSKDGKLISEFNITKNTEITKKINLNYGANNFSAVFAPAAGQDLTSFDSITSNKTVILNSYDLNTLYVSPNGTSDSAGTKESPLDIYTATRYALPGQTVALKGGTYYLTSGLKIERGNNGTAQDYKVLTSLPGERAVLNFSKANAGMVVTGDYWNISNIDVTSTINAVKGLQISGNNIIVDGVNSYKNGDTGIQISRDGSVTPDKWPCNNFVVNCTSYDNRDKEENNADGFAAKETVGSGNVFRNCISHNNCDDGWDLFAAYGMSKASVTTVENCIAYSNGMLSNGDKTVGDGNGFKMGGRGYSIPNKLVNCIAFNNKADGFTSNSNSSAIVENCTMFNNGSSNYSFDIYSYSKPRFKAENNISFKNSNKTADGIVPFIDTVLGKTNYFFDGSTYVNTEGSEITADMFESLDTSKLPTRNADGSINMNGLLVLKSNAPKGIGAVIEKVVYGDTKIKENIPHSDDSDSNSGGSSGGSIGGGANAPVSISEAVDKIATAPKGSVTVVSMATNEPAVSSTLFEDIKGKDAGVQLNFGSFVWNFNGKDIKDIPGDRVFYNMGVQQITQKNISDAAGSSEVIQLELAHNGLFPCAMNLTFNVGSSLSGKTVYLNYFNEKTGKLEPTSAGTVDQYGNATFTLPHASKYVVTSENVAGLKVDDKQPTKAKAAANSGKANIKTGAPIMPLEAQAIIENPTPYTKSVVPAQDNAANGLTKAEQSNNNTAVIIVLAALLAAAAGGYFFFKYRKHN